MSYVLVFVFGLAAVEVIASLIYRRWRADRSDPYVTLSDRRARLRKLKEEGCAK